MQLQPPKQFDGVISHFTSTLNTQPDDKFYCSQMDYLSS